MILYAFILFFGTCCEAKCPYEEKIVRPCPGLKPNCVRNYFAEHSYCTPAHGCSSEPYNIKELVMPMPYANMTYIWKDIDYKGLQDGRILEFYINGNTNNLVIEIEFSEVSVYSADTSIKYYFRGREPIVLKGYSGISYTLLSLTATVPLDSEGRIKWSERDVYPYFGGTAFPYVVDRQSLCNLKPEVAAHFEQAVGNKVLGTKEAFITVGPRIFDLYFYRHICKF